ncbi:unnamed protein product [Bursaphelenchus okinawaensis]|uniref:Uncharacterized protein n=1 Tax=Bursaphelenchus okinawaensis TaxID=465554 RepID=A0A811KTD3_9BILA|nr:unnamed protein product [Bursaphelenchus okinawaensis]CAG9110805.1 unnamed protein product [Bursaphelenchus okinawaensis]
MDPSTSSESAEKYYVAYVPEMDNFAIVGYQHVEENMNADGTFNIMVNDKNAPAQIRGCFYSQHEAMLYVNSIVNQSKPEDQPSTSAASVDMKEQMNVIPLDPTNLANLVVNVGAEDLRNLTEKVVAIESRLARNEDLLLNTFAKVHNAYDLIVAQNDSIQKLTEMVDRSNGTIGTNGAVITVSAGMNDNNNINGFTGVNFATGANSTSGVNSMSSGATSGVFSRNNGSADKNQYQNKYNPTAQYQTVPSTAPLSNTYSNTALNTDQIPASNSSSAQNPALRAPSSQTSSTLTNLLASTSTSEAKSSGTGKHLRLVPMQNYSGMVQLPTGTVKLENGYITQPDLSNFGVNSTLNKALKAEMLSPNGATSTVNSNGTNRNGNGVNGTAGNVSTNNFGATGTNGSFGANTANSSYTTTGNGSNNSFGTAGVNSNINTSTSGTNSNFVTTGTRNKTRGGTNNQMNRNGANNSTSSTIMGNTSTGMNSTSNMATAGTSGTTNGFVTVKSEFLNNGTTNSIFTTTLSDPNQPFVATKPAYNFITEADCLSLWKLSNNNLSSFLDRLNQKVFALSELLKPLEQRPEEKVAELRKIIAFYSNPGNVAAELLTWQSSVTQINNFVNKVLQSDIFQNQIGPMKKRGRPRKYLTPYNNEGEGGQ